jgi:diguanylate cyclase (GGDEF)-like protein
MKAPIPTLPSESDIKHCSILDRLGIRASLLLGFGVMCAVIALIAFAAQYAITRVGESTGRILEHQLPVTLQILQVARAADALASTGVPLGAIITDEARRMAFHRVDEALLALDQSLGHFTGVAHSGMGNVRRLTEELTRNIGRLREKVSVRIQLVQTLAKTRERLLLNLQSFQQQLTYRIRIMQANGEVIEHLMSYSTPPVDRVAAIALEMSPLISLAEFYGKVESIHGRLLVASQDQTLSALNVSRQILNNSLHSAHLTFERLPANLFPLLAEPLAELQNLILSEEGLVALRERELLLSGEIQNLIAENQQITHAVETTTAELVGDTMQAINEASAVASETRRQYMLIMAVVIGFGLFCIAVLMHFHINRHVIKRLSWLSKAMQDIAAGRLDIPLPPSGDSELGRLGSALHQFRSITVKADQALLALEQKAEELEVANCKLAELSVLDALTGLYNRRRFDEALNSEWTRAMRSGQPVALMMIDVDLFKKFNDKYGHQAGDDCLRQVASTIKASACRTSDLAVRYGGEEFCVLVPYAHLDPARVLAEAIRRSVEALAIMHEKSPFGIVTISIGLSIMLPDSTRTPRDFLRTADEALYEAKAGGRNRVIEAH